MTDPPSSDRWLPGKLEQRVIEILELPDEQGAAALEDLYREHPEHASRIRERLGRARQIQLRIESSRPAEDAAQPERIGPYRILDVLGEGGMGTVYLAEQREPVQRRVALKVIKPGMDTKQVLARFEVERQALAIMDHPGIARVLDAGRTEHGRSYFAMEFVRGIPITDFCDKRRLGVRERLSLFREVCAAVQHAHHKGIIHRDLKPSNVLVAEEGGAALPKIIDFGLARATDHRLGGQTFVTRRGMIVGTPEYMSPEQAEMSGLDVDTRTDIYSLGVVLYELLVGALPFDPKELRDAGLVELQRRIVEDEPQKPSTRLTTSGDHATSETAVRRRTDAAGLIRTVRGDLDWITMKALAKDRAERYQSASELAADLERLLNDEPVLASPPSVRYRLGKLLRRYRAQVAAAAGVLAALVLGLVVSTALYFEATAAKREAQSSAGEAGAVSDFLVELFESAAPYRSLGEDLPVRRLLDVGAERIQGELADQPAMRAKLLCTFAQVYRWLGSHDKAAQFLEEGLALHRQIRGPEHPDTLSWELEHGRLLLSRDDNERAEAWLRELCDRLGRTVGPRSALTGQCHLHLGDALRRLGRRDAAGEHFEVAVEILREIHQGDHLDVAEALGYLGGNLYDRGRPERAIELLEHAAAMLARVEPRPTPTSVSLQSSVARCRTALERHDDAEAAARLALAGAEQVFGHEHRSVAGAALTYAHCLSRAGRHRDAEPHLRRALEIYERVLDPDASSIAWVANDLGLLVGRLGRFDESVELLRRAFEIYRNLHAGDHLFVAIAMHNLAEALAQAGALEAAERLARDNLAMRQRLEPEPGANVARGLGMLGMVLLVGGELDEAERHALQARAIWERLRPDGDDPDVARLLASIHLEQGRGAAAEADARRVLAAFGSPPEDWPQVATALDLLGRAQLLQGDRSGAEASFREAVERYERHYPDGHPGLASAVRHLGTLLAETDPDRALPWLERALDMHRASLHSTHLERIRSLVALGALHSARREYERAEPLLLEAEAAADPGRADAHLLPDVRAALVTLYEGWGKAGAADKYRRPRDG